MASLPRRTGQTSPALPRLTSEGTKIITDKEWRDNGKKYKNLIVINKEKNCQCQTLSMKTLKVALCWSIFWSIQDSVFWYFTEVHLNNGLCQHLLPTVLFTDFLSDLLLNIWKLELPSTKGILLLSLMLELRMTMQNKIHLHINLADAWRLWFDRWSARKSASLVIMFWLGVLLWQKNMFHWAGASNNWFEKAYGQDHKNLSMSLHPNHILHVNPNFSNPVKLFTRSTVVYLQGLGKNRHARKRRTKCQKRETELVSNL